MRSLPSVRPSPRSFVQRSSVGDPDLAANGNAVGKGYTYLETKSEKTKTTNDGGGHGEGDNEVAYASVGRRDIVAILVGNGDGCRVQWVLCRQPRLS